MLILAGTAAECCLLLVQLLSVDFCWFRLNQDLSDPIIFATGYKKSRFYLFSRREPEDQSTGDVGRDVFNLKPTREEQLAASGAVSSRKLAEQVTIHTTLGDITISLFLREVTPHWRCFSLCYLRCHAVAMQFPSVLLFG